MTSQQVRPAAFLQLAVFLLNTVVTPVLSSPRDPLARNLGSLNPRASSGCHTDFCYSDQTCCGYVCCDLDQTCTNEDTDTLWYCLDNDIISESNQYSSYIDSLTSLTDTFPSATATPTYSYSDLYTYPYPTGTATATDNAAAFETGLRSGDDTSSSGSSLSGFKSKTKPKKKGFAGWAAGKKVAAILVPILGAALIAGAGVLGAWLKKRKDKKAGVTATGGNVNVTNGNTDTFPPGAAPPMQQQQFHQGQQPPAPAYSPPPAGAMAAGLHENYGVKQDAGVYVDSVSTTPQPQPQYVNEANGGYINAPIGVEQGGVPQGMVQQQQVPQPLYNENTGSYINTEQQPVFEAPNHGNLGNGHA